jgi:cytochrome c-type biogenesis protein CcmH
LRTRRWQAGTRATWRCVSLIAVLWIFSHAARAIDPVELPDPALQARYQELIHEFRCMQCQNESLADSAVSLAGDLRREIREQLLAGRSDAQIRDFLVSRYGEFILFRPRFSARNAWLWLAPGVLLVIGAAIGWGVLRDRQGLLASDPGPVEDEAPRA